MAALPNHLIPPAQFYALKTTVLVMLCLWLGVQKKPKDAEMAFRATLRNAIKGLHRNDIPVEHWEAFRDAVERFSMGILDSAAQSHDLPEGPNRAQ